MTVLSQDEIDAWKPTRCEDITADKKKRLREAIQQTSLDNPFQIAGHHFAMGCVALEITQRCNLDCTACYLSDLSEAVRDLPLSEVFRRIDLITEHYGANTNVQITGGDPTLRKRDELIAIVRRIAERGLRGALFTNGIKADRTLLKDLKNAGLKDVAFHVDMTQERKGYGSERALNTVREEYLKRARALGLQIIFNTTVTNENLSEIPALTAFFTKHAKDIHLASFQMIADTGRGTERDRPDGLTQENLQKLISEGAGADLSFNYPQVGHLDCNRYAKCLVAGPARTSAFHEDDRPFFEKLLPQTRYLFLNRHAPIRSLTSLGKRLMLVQPTIVLMMVAYGARKLWQLKGGLVKGHIRPHMLTFYIHNFMHAKALEAERCEACVFMTMTRDGPISMCVHNAKRDSFILQTVKDDHGNTFVPLENHDRLVPDVLPLKRLKGRARVSRKETALRRPIKGNIGERMHS